MRRLVTILVFALAAVACTDGGAESTTTEGPQVETTTTTGPGTTVVSETSTSAATGSADVTPIGIDELPPELRDDVLDLVAITQELRQLDFLSAPTITVVDDEELARRVRESIEEEAEGVVEDETLYKLIGLLPAETDLLALYSDLYGEQVGGFYDGDEGELVIPSGETLTAYQKSVLVHELTHALTDQHFEMSNTMDSLVEEERFDEASAYLSVIEGDATVTQVLYIQTLDLGDQQELISESLEADTTVFDAAPLFLAESLTFPYDEGFVFAQRLFSLGGFQEIDKAYKRPPVSTEQIYEPRDFGRDEPIELPAIVVDLDGYELIYDSVWGQLGFQTMFEQVLGSDAATAAADGWGGDRYSYFFDGTEGALVLEYVGDTEADANELYDALLGYAPAAMSVGEASSEGEWTVFSGDDFAAVRLDGDTVSWVVAGDPTAGRELISR